LSAEGISGWPATALLSQYGIQNLTLPTGATTPTYSNTSDQIAIMFYGTSATESAVKSYFSTWTSNGPLAYSKGYAYAEFNTSDSPYYEIDVSFAPPDDAGSGWPSTQLAQYQLSGLNQPTGATQIYYDDSTANQLTIMFYGTSASESAVKSYFSGWTPDGSSAYSKGYAYVEFDTTASPYYEINISWTPDGSANWPSTSVLDSYGLQGMTQPAGATLIYYDATAGQLTIKFYGTSASESAVKSYFSTSNNWTSSSGSYSRGNAYVEFDTTGSPYYEINVYWTPGANAGWPSTSILDSFGLQGMTQPAGATQIYYDTSTANQLNITFYGTSATETAVEGYFSSGAWSSDTPPSTGNFAYGTDAGGYAEFYVTSRPYYELNVSK